MPNVGWFPRFNEDGSKLTWERPGRWRAQFINYQTEIADDGANLLIGGARTSFPSCNELSAGGDRFAALRTDPVRVFTGDGQTLLGAGCPTMSPDGKLGYVDVRQAPVKNLVFDGRVVTAGAITSVRASRSALAWLDNGQAWGWRRDRPGAVAQRVQVAPWEGSPVPVEVPDGPWIGSNTQTGIILRPFGSSVGYRFDNGGQTYYPDWAYQNGVIVAVFTDDKGVQTWHPFNLSAPRVPLDVPSNVPIVVPDVGRPIWFGWFVGTPSSGGGWSTTLAPTSVPGNCYVEIPGGEIKTFDGRRIGWYCNGDPDSDSDAIDRAVAATKAAHTGERIFVYWPRQAWSRVPACDDVLVEAYQLAGESPDAFLSRVLAAMARCRRPALCVQAFTSNASLTTNLTGVALVAAQIAKDEGCSLFMFNGTGRRTGLEDHPEVRPVWQEAFAGVTGEPPIVSPPVRPILPVHPRPTTPPLVNPHTLIRYRMEHSMQTERGGLVGPKGLFARIDPNESGKGLFGWFPVHFDAQDSSGNSEFELTDLGNGRFTAVLVPTGAFLGMDMTEFSDDLTKQFYGKPPDLGAGGYEQPYGFGPLPDTGCIILMVQYPLQGGAAKAAFCSTPVSWVKQ